MPTADSLIGRVPAVARYGLAILLLCGLILAMVMQRASILRDGREVLLEVVPVDPRDLFRGDYVILSYRIGTVELPKGELSSFKREQEVFVTLRPDESGKARAVSVSASRPDVIGQDIVIAGRVTSAATCPLRDDGRRECKNDARAVAVAYGLESYFVPQGEGKAIERTEKRRIEVVAAVTASGQSAIKRLMLDGRAVYSEPPY